MAFAYNPDGGYLIYIDNKKLGSVWRDHGGWSASRYDDGRIEVTGYTRHEVAHRLRNLGFLRVVHTTIDDWLAAGWTEQS
jgi:hypothetical protein